MPVRIIEKPTKKAELADLELKIPTGNLVKAVVDVKKGIMIAGMTMHSDGQEKLLEQGSKQTDLWGINLYLQESENNSLEYDSVINLRPGQGNYSRSVDDPEIREQIQQIITKLVKWA